MRHRLRTRVALSLFAAGSLALSVLSEIPSALADENPAQVDRPAIEETAAARALASARATGKPVEVQSERDEFSSTFANPDGTLTRNVSPAPVHVIRNGTWIDVDLSLEHTASGWSPRVSPAPVSFSDGGPGDAAIIGSGATELTLGWDVNLPTPVITDDTATYDLGDGQLLELRATTGGYEQSLVLLRAPSTLPRQRLPFDANGLALRDDRADGFKFVNGQGATVYQIPAPYMYDASRDPDTQVPINTRPVASGIVQTPDGPRLDLTPSLTWLQDPSTRYPVVIDPAITVGDAADSWVKDDITTNQSHSEALRIGDFNGHAARAYIQFSGLDSLDYYSTINSAKLNMYFTGGQSCTPAPLNANPISAWRSGTNNGNIVWSNRPTINYAPSLLGTAKIAHGSAAGAGCNNAWDTIDITAMVSAWVSGSIPNYGLQLSHDESSGRAEDWTACSRNPAANGSACIYSSRVPTLAVNFTPPKLETPTLSDMCAEPGDDSCASGGDVANSIVRLRGRSPSGGDDHTYKFEVWQTDSTAAPAATKTAATDEAAGAGIVFALKRDVDYRYRVNLSDSYTTSPWSPWYAFTTRAPDVTNVSARTIFDNTASSTPSLGVSETKQVSVAGSGIPEPGAKGFATVDLTATISSTTNLSAYVEFDGDFTAYDGPDVYRGAVKSTAFNVRAGIDENSTITITNTGDQPARLKIVLTGWDSYFQDADESQADNMDFVDDGTPAPDSNADTNETRSDRNVTSAAFGDVRDDGFGSEESVSDPGIAGTDGYEDSYNDVVDEVDDIMPTQCGQTDPSAGEDPGPACPEQVMPSTQAELDAVQARVSQQNQAAGIRYYANGSTSVDDSDFDYSTGTYGSAAPGEDETIYPDTSATTIGGANASSTNSTTAASNSPDVADGQFRAGGYVGIPNGCVYYKKGHYYSRNLSCRYWYLDVSLVKYTNQTPKTVGHAYFDMFQIERTNPKTHKIVTVWSCNEFRATGVGTEGELKGTAVMRASTGTRGGKTYKSHKQKVTFRRDKVGHAVWAQDVGKPTLGSKITSYASVVFDLALTASDGTYSGDFTLADAKPRRTDNFQYLPGVGTVLPSVAPTMRSLSTRDPSVARAAAFYRRAQNTIYGSNSKGGAYHPGRPGPGNTVLIRIDPGANNKYKRRNSYWACKGVPTPRPKGYQCDEYPFASTRNGGYLFHHPLSQGVLMPARQNIKAGNLLGDFYARQRVAYGDRLWVQIQ